MKLLFGDVVDFKVIGNFDLRSSVVDGLNLMNVGVM